MVGLCVGDGRCVVHGRETGRHDIGSGAGRVAVRDLVAERDVGDRVGSRGQPQVLDVGVEDDVVSSHVGV